MFIIYPSIEFFIIEFKASLAQKIAPLTFVSKVLEISSPVISVNTETKIRMYSRILNRDEFEF